MKRLVSLGEVLKKMSARNSERGAMFAAAGLVDAGRRFLETTFGDRAGSFRIVKIQHRVLYVSASSAPAAAALKSREAEFLRAMNAGNKKPTVDRISISS